MNELQHEVDGVNIFVPRSKYKRQQKVKNKQQINVVFNYSKVTLTKEMDQVLNLGLNFAILPKKLDITQVLCDFKKFERKIIWREFFSKKDDIEDHYIPPIFKSRKTNLPKNHKIPEELKIFLGAIRSEILDPKNRHKNNCNVSKEILEALLELVKMQKECKIIIKRCDKGAGIIVLDYEEYMNACYVHLNARLTMKDGSTKEYYTKMGKGSLEEASTKLKLVLEEALDNKIISNDEYQAMNPDGKTPGKFYCTFKVHKPHEPLRAPPERPIISACGSIMENASQFIKHHINKHGTKHQSYIQDTPDFLRHLEELNEGGQIQIKSILASWDVIGLFTNIPHSEGLEAVRETMEKDKPA